MQGKGFPGRLVFTKNNTISFYVFCSSDFKVEFTDGFKPFNNELCPRAGYGVPNGIGERERKQDKWGEYKQSGHLEYKKHPTPIRPYLRDSEPPTS